MIEDQNKGVLTGVRMPLLPYLHSRKMEDGGKTDGM